MRLGRFDEAAEWAVRAATRPNAHEHIRAISMYCLALAGRALEAQEVAAAIQRARGGYRVEEFFAAFKLGDEAKARVREAAGLVGR